MRAGFDPERWREEFPALRRRIGGRPVLFLDGPAGSQVPRGVIEAVARYLTDRNANSDGVFPTSRESDALIELARGAVADLLGSGDPDLTVFGPNMTTLTLGLSRALGRTWKPGDEVVVTRMEHDANFTPWVQAARDAGAALRVAGIRPRDCTLDMEDLRSAITERTRLVAVGAASNAVGTINPVGEIVGFAHDAGALVFVDAVHYAPHALIDVKEWDCDFVACSAYKFFGPHVGILHGKRHLLESLPVYKLRPCTESLPVRWETGTQSHEGIAGTLAAVDYLASIGGGHDGGPGGTGNEADIDPDRVRGRSRPVEPRGPRPRSGRSEGAASAAAGQGGAPPAGRRQALRSAFRLIGEHERALAARLIEGLRRIPGLKVWGITDPARFADRVPTVAVTHERLASREVAGILAERGIFVWDGNYYALPLTEALGLEPEGAVRIGLLHYNTAGEVDRLLEELRRL